MKNKILILGIFALAAAPAFAEATVGQVSSPSYMLQTGYSSTVAEMVGRYQAQTKGVPYTGPAAGGYYYQPLDWTDNEYANKAIQYVRNAFIYLDPGLDTGSFMNHDIKFTPQYDDL